MFFQALPACRMLIPEVVLDQGGQAFHTVELFNPVPFVLFSGSEKDPDTEDVVRVDHLSTHVDIAIIWTLGHRSDGPQRMQVLFPAQDEEFGWQMFNVRRIVQITRAGSPLSVRALDIGMDFYLAHLYSVDVAHCATVTTLLEFEAQAEEVSHPKGPTKPTY